MRLIEPTFQLTTPFGPLTREMGIQMLRFIETEARKSHRSEGLQTENSWERFLTSVVLTRKDWSVCEHASVTCDMRVDRGSWLEIRTHGFFAYTAESTRFVNYGKKGHIEIIRPLGISTADEKWLFLMHAIETEYARELEEARYKPQDARSVLPNCLAVSIGQTGNLRAWRNFFLMRTTQETHPELRRTTVPMLEAFKQAIPLLYDDILPGARQAENESKQ